MAPHHAILDEALTRVAEGKIKRLIVEMPPRHGKSEICSRYFPAWYGMRFSGRDLIVTGADATLSEEFSKSARDLVEEHGPSMFGVDLHPTRRRVDDWELTNGTRVRAAGVGGSIMGRGADVLLIDDYLKNIEQALSPTIRRKLLQWYLTTAKTRLSPDGAVVMIATRWHKEDLIGEMLKSQATPEGDQWVRICLPAEAEENDPLGRERGAALWPGRWTLDKLTAIRREYELRGYGWMYSALYQQRPPSVLDATWAEELLEGDDLWFDDWPHPSHIDVRIMSLDPSLGETKQSDFSAIVMLALVDGLLFVDVDMDRRDPFRITEDSMQNCLLFNPNVFAIESNQFQAFLASYFEAEAEKRKMLVPVVTLHNRMKKAERIRAGLTSYLRRRQIRFKRNSPGVALLMEQLRGFPSHDHDDGPDALEMAIRMAQLVHSGEVPLEA